MNTTTHPFEREEVMAYLDGELEAGRAVALAEHLEICADCATLARELRRVSQQLTAWPVEASPERLAAVVNSAVEQHSAARPKLKQVKRAPRKWFPQWALATVGGFAVLLMLLAVTTPKLLRSRMTANTTSAVGSLRSLNTACVQYASTYGVGFPRHISQLGPGSPPSKDAADLIDSVLASGTKSGYRFTYTPGAVDATGNVIEYTITAQPASAESGQRCFYTDESGVIRSNERGPADANSPSISGSDPGPRERSKPRAAAGEARHLAGRQTSTPLGPMIVRSASLTITTKEFENARAAMEQILRQHNGYVAQLSARGSAAAGRRSITATLRVPAGSLDAALAELKKLGRVESESLWGEEVSKQHADLVSRQSNAQNTEKRLNSVLENRTGKVADVLEVEREIARVRQEIEHMDAERKGVENQIAFATVQVGLEEEYRAALNVTPPSSGSRLRNAVVEGYEDMVDTALSLALFLLSAGPTLLFWALLLFWPVRAAWRRVRTAQRVIEKAA